MIGLRIKYEGWLNTDDGAEHPGSKTVTGCVLAIVYDMAAGHVAAAVAGDDGRCYSLPFAQCTQIKEQNQ